MALRYKFIELSIVTDETIEVAVNHWVAQGWQLDGIRFVTSERSKRPAMAYVSFTCAAAEPTRTEPTEPAERATVAGSPHVLVADDNDVD